MNLKSLSQDEPGCSHSPRMVKAIENENESVVKELVTCVLEPQTEANVSKENAVDLKENNTGKCKLKETLPYPQHISEQHIVLDNNESVISKELAIHEPHSDSITLIKPNENNDTSVKIGLRPGQPDNSVKHGPRQSRIPLILISRPPSFILDHVPTMDPITTQPQPRTIAIPLNPQSTTLRPSSNTETPSGIAAMPPSLFIQALSKINQSSLSLSLLNQLQDIVKNSKDARNRNVSSAQAEISAPNSITESAPPSYSFVLRQNSRRPQLMGTFIPSPSFIPLTPPPNYAAAFDIYVDNSAPPPSPRPVNYGFTPMPVVCPICGVAGISIIHSKITVCTHLCAVLMCLFCCWLCVPLPYLLNSCKDVYHYCSNCRNYLGMYCPTNPETPTTTSTLI